MTLEYEGCKVEENKVLGTHIVRIIFDTDSAIVNFVEDDNKLLGISMYKTPDGKKTVIVLVLRDR